jgi:calcium/calmodulin-dependent protein kinase I
VKKESCDEFEAAAFVKEILEGVAYCHDQKIVHRDLKPENLLLTRTNSGLHIKIADFGIAQDRVDVLATVSGTPLYMAPEMITGETYDKQVDVWPVGVISYILLCGYPPFNESSVFDEITTATFDFPMDEWSGISKEAKDFIGKLLVVDPKVRLTTEQALKHEWIINNTSKSSGVSPMKIERTNTLNAQKFKSFIQLSKDHKL